MCSELRLGLFFCENIACMAAALGCIILFQSHCDSKQDGAYIWRFGSIHYLALALYGVGGELWA